MNKSDFIELLATDADIKKAEAKVLLDVFEKSIIKALKKDGECPLGSLGKIKLKMSPARIAKNPATGATVSVPAKQKLKMTFSKAAKQSLGL